MNLNAIVVLAVLSIAAINVLAEEAEGSIDVTIFELKDGKSVTAFRFLASGEGEDQRYDVTTIDGKRQTLLEKDIAKQRKSTVPAANAAASIHDEIRRRKQAGALDSPESESHKRLMVSLRQAIDANDAANRAAKAAADARSQLDEAQRELAEVDAARVKQDAIIEGLLTQVFIREKSDSRRLDLERARVEQHRLKQLRQPLADKVFTLKQRVAELNEKCTYTKTELETARKNAAIARRGVVNEDGKSANVLPPTPQAGEKGEKEKLLPGLPGAKRLTVTLADGTKIDAVSLTDKADGKMAIIKDCDGVVHHVKHADIAKTEKVVEEE